MKTVIRTAALSFIAGSTLAHAAGADRAIRGSTLGLVKSQKPIGAHAANADISVTVTLKERNQALLKKLTANLGQPGFQPITQAEWQAKFAPSQAQLNKVAAWAKSQGLSVTSTADGNVEVNGKTSQLEATFKTPINDYSSAQGTIYANAKNISVPKSLPINGVFGLDDARVAQPLTAGSMAAKWAKVKPVAQ